MLHSLKGASNVIFINFLGGIVANTQWNFATGQASFSPKPFDTDGNTAFFSATEKLTISYIWNRVAEDFAPWNVDVTTEPPTVFGPTTGNVMVTSSIDARGISLPNPSGGGVSYINVWGMSNYST